MLLVKKRNLPYAYIVFLEARVHLNNSLVISQNNLCWSVEYVKKQQYKKMKKCSIFMHDGTQILHNYPTTDISTAFILFKLKKQKN